MTSFSIKAQTSSLKGVQERGAPGRLPGGCRQNCLLSAEEEVRVPSRYDRHLAVHVHLPALGLWHLAASLSSRLLASLSSELSKTCWGEAACLQSQLGTIVERGKRPLGTNPPNLEGLCLTPLVGRPSAWAFSWEGAQPSGKCPKFLMVEVPQQRGRGKAQGQWRL